ncbi:GCN5-like N-acetyltransferase [Halosimplex carlsbadense 2-9-1]|uniref:GCN5-like N-acetyltransferase n=1 Tax=Halosimplex carlsbadense 2-9-1 TaxID=797114 RepID=M0D0E9_9EURY|nr:GNAT family N-acetyltransferase [Halosimplex carlsbadense]ELZ28147.1 GCN5-like N-acetyltransferase [Halosimplex carlsbadense 2-9-1]
MATEVRKVTTDDGWDEAVAILRQLWTHVDDAFVYEWRDEDDYRLFGLYETDESDGPGTDSEALVAVAGVSIQRVLHHERHLWVHDFVVDEPRRGEGFGGELLDWLDGWARDRDCEHLALACRDGNDAGREFYESEGLEVWGQVLEREL